MTIAQAKGALQNELRQVSAAHEAREMLQYITGYTWAQLLCKSDEPLQDDQKRALGEMCAQRLLGRPLAYILGEWTFMGLPMVVREGVLIPREDTEVLVRCAWDFANAHGVRTALDLCCGSGCIGVALAEFANLQVVCADISECALSVARENARKNSVEERLCFVQGDLFENMRSVCGEFDLIACNPPYIAQEEMRGLQREVRDFEPHLALSGGLDGLDFYRRIAVDARGFLARGGVLCLEVGAAQAAPVCDILRGNGWGILSRAKDLAGLERVVAVERL